jgi:hypothetical protein
MPAPNTLIAEDNGVPVTLDAPGTGESGTQALFQRCLKPLLDGLAALQLHKVDVGEDVFATEAYVDNQVREVRAVKKVAGGGGTTYTVSSTDEVINAVTAAGTLTLNLQCYTNINANLLTIIDQGKNAAVNNIILHPETGKSINGGTAGANVSLTASGGTWSVTKLADGTGYWVSGPL